jgi:hypothetical protein
METTKYEKYIVRNTLDWNIFPPYTPRLLFDSKNHFPEMNFGIRYTYINEPIQMERPHAHDFDQFFCFLGTPEDQRVFDGEVELYLGEEETKNIINSTSVVYVPKGLIHCPVIWKRVSQPMMFVNIVLASSYTRSDQHMGYFDRLELTAKEVTIEEAAQFLGVKVPQPNYLPEGYEVQGIYALDNSVKMYYSDEPIEKRIISMGDAGEARQQYAFQCKMGLTIKWYPKGKNVEKAQGESINVGQYEGVVVDGEQHYELWWLMPVESGQYEIVLAAGKKTPKEELIKIAQSFQ